MTSRCPARSPRRSRISPSDPCGRPSRFPATRTPRGRTSCSRIVCGIARRSACRKACAGKSFYLVFPQNNLNTTVYVNGVYCGFDKNPFARVQIDISKGNQARRQRSLGRHPRCLVRLLRQSKKPYEAPQSSSICRRSSSTMGSSGSPIPSGMHPSPASSSTPELVCAGPAYASDVFCKPSVSKQEAGPRRHRRNGGKEPMSRRSDLRGRQRQGAGREDVRAAGVPARRHGA